MTLRYLSVCSGIEAATQAWHPLGWKPVAFSEIEPFPCAVLAHRYPDVPNWGDMTKYEDWPDADVDVLCGGTPCQSFSVAGLRKGLADPRGNLMLTFGAIAGRYRPRWLVWENVPGVLSSNGGRDFGAFLAMLGELGYGWAYRVLDAQHVRTRRFPFAVPQRRRRVFVVGHLGDWRRAAAVLFDRESLSGNPAPRRNARQGTSCSVDAGIEASGTLCARTGLSRGVQDCEQGHIIGMAQPMVLMERGRDGGSNLETRQDGTANAILTPNGGRGGLGVGAVAFDTAQITSPQNRSVPQSVAPTMAKGSQLHGAGAWQVRRLTPVECSRLQGFPDTFTRIPYRGKPAEACPDGPQYKALGNSWAVNCAEWIGERLDEVERWT